MPCGPPPTAPPRSTRSTSAARRWSCSTSGCRARASTGCSCSRRSSAATPSLPVLMISGHGNLDTAVAAVREGAIDFIEKPFEAERLVYLVDRATETDRLRRENDDAAPAGRPGRAAPRHLGGHQHRPRDAEARRADRQPGADHRAGRSRQGNCGADDPPVEPARQGAVHRPVGGDDEPRAGRGGIVRQRGGRRGAARACSSRRMAGPCSSTRSPTCR